MWCGREEYGVYTQSDDSDTFRAEILPDERVVYLVSDGSGDYARELMALRQVLEESPVVGHPRREAELAELRRLITRYPDEARDMLHEAGR
jgi:hypothetical protein